MTNKHLIELLIEIDSVNGHAPVGIFDDDLNDRLSTAIREGLHLDKTTNRVYCKECFNPQPLDRKEGDCINCGKPIQYLRAIVKDMPDDYEMDN